MTICNIVFLSIAKRDKLQGKGGVLMRVLGQRIRRLRKQARLTQEELGKKLGCSASTISLYESGHRSPDATMLIKLADVFNVSTDYLLGRVENPSVETRTDDAPPATVAAWPFTEDLTPEGIEFLQALAAEVRKRFARKNHRNKGKTTATNGKNTTRKKGSTGAGSKSTSPGQKNSEEESREKENGQHRNQEQQQQQQQQQEQQ